MNKIIKWVIGVLIVGALTVTITLFTKKRKGR